MGSWTLPGLRKKSDGGARAPVPTQTIPAFQLAGERVFVRPPSMEDWPSWALVRGRNRSHLEPFEPEWSDDCLKPEFYRRRLDRQTREWITGRGFAFLIFRKPSADLIGGINVNNVTRGAAQFASVGYWIDEAAQGQGHMREALQLVLSFCFDELHLNRINAASLPHNSRSIGMLRRLGFEEEGFARRYIQIQGDYADHVLFGLLAQDYRKRF